jgi:hypothetical protein
MLLQVIPHGPMGFQLDAARPVRYCARLFGRESRIRGHLQKPGYCQIRIFIAHRSGVQSKEEHRKYSRDCESVHKTPFPIACWARGFRPAFTGWRNLKCWI